MSPRELRDAFLLGARRTALQDMGFLHAEATAFLDLARAALDGVNRQTVEDQGTDLLRLVGHLPATAGRQGDKAGEG